MQDRSRWLAEQHPSYEEHASLDVLRKCRNGGIHAGVNITLADASNELRAAIATVVHWDGAGIPAQVMRGFRCVTVLVENRCIRRSPLSDTSSRTISW